MKKLFEAVVAKKAVLVKGGLVVLGVGAVGLIVKALRNASSEYEFNVKEAVGTESEEE